MAERALFLYEDGEYGGAARMAVRSLAVSGRRSEALTRAREVAAPYGWPRDDEPQAGKAW